MFWPTSNTTILNWFNTERFITPISVYAGPPQASWNNANTAALPVHSGGAVFTGILTISGNLQKSYEILIDYTR
jgi:hypothetical protein